MNNHLHPIFQQVLAPFAPPPEIDIKKRVRDAIAAGKDPIVEHAGDTWRVMSIGAASSGAHWCHLASETRMQRPPFDDSPVQCLDRVSDDVLAQALSRGIK